MHTLALTLEGLSTKSYQAQHSAGCERQQRQLSASCLHLLHIHQNSLNIAECALQHALLYPAHKTCEGIMHHCITLSHSCSVCMKLAPAATPSRIQVIGTVQTRPNGNDLCINAQPLRFSQAWDEAYHILDCLQAFLDTILVLAIVSASGSLLFGCNVVLSAASEWWYHRG